ncbi:FtsX-like permease family protein [Rhizohabitans arisaemae]|uniref:FtsX-like permease family protein n=1 Tax=Rhizohabitans arisaemae TaxID=2720610 RepID=UPI0024B0CDE3|nr:FtsX-like permease family protein [Rhizohabitans arisaemae]
MSPLTVLIRLIRSRAAAALVLALLILVAVSLVSGLARRFEGAYDTALRAQLGRALPGTTDLLVSQLGTADPTRRPSSPEEITGSGRTWHGLLAPELSAFVGEAQARVNTLREPVIEGLPNSTRAADQFTDVTWLSGTERHITYVAGGPPAASSPPVKHAKLGLVPSIDLAVSARTAEMMEMKVGTVFFVGTHNLAYSLKISGIWRANDPASPYWARVKRLLEPEIKNIRHSQAFEMWGEGLTGAEGFALLAKSSSTLHYQWGYPVIPAKVTAEHAPSLIGAVKAFEAAVTKHSATGDAASVSSGITPLLEGFLRELGTTQTIMWLVLAALLGVALGVTALAVNLFTDRLEPGFQLMRGRGASPAQLLTLGGLSVAVVTLPPAVAGYLIGVAVPGRTTAVAVAAPVLIGVGAVLFALFGVGRLRPYGARRHDLAGSGTSAPRLVFDGLVVVLAVVGVVLIRQRGLTTDTGDPLTIAAPSLLTLAVSLIVLRLYPYPLRLVSRLAARSTAAVPFLGAAGAARSRALTALPVLILLPATAITVFGSSLSAGLSQAQEEAAWRLTGAGARMAADHPFSAAAVERVRRVAGVEQVLPAFLDTTAQLRDGTPHGIPVTFLAVDLKAYRELVEGSPLGLPAAPTAVPAGWPTPDATPVLAHPQITRLRPPNGLEVRADQGVTLPIAATAALDGFPRITDSPNPLIVGPYSALRDPKPTMLLIRGSGIDPAQLRAAVAEETTHLTALTHEGVLASMTGSPMSGVMHNALLVTVVAMAGYCLIAVLLSLALGSAERTRTASLLRTLGLSGRQARTLTLLEIGPIIGIAAITGLGLGSGLPQVIGAGIDLSGYAGGIPVDHYAFSPVLPGLLALGITALTIAGVSAVTAVSGRRSLGTVLRIGDQE